MPKVKICKVKSKSAKNVQAGMGDILKEVMFMDRKSDEISNPELILTKYQRFGNSLREFTNEMMRFIFKIKEESLKNDLEIFSKFLLAEYMKLYSLDLTPYTMALDLNSVEKPLLMKLKIAYLDIKESIVVKFAIMVSKNIRSSKLTRAKYAEFLEKSVKGLTTLLIFDKIQIGADKKEIRYDFCTIFNGSSTSVKYTEEELVQVYDLIMKLKVCGNVVARIFREPDIDIKVIFPKVMEMIKKFQGETRGCDRAFNIIKNSSDIFEKNYKKYISSATNSGNPVSIFTDFVQDVIAANQGKMEEDSGKAVISELKTVIRHIRLNINKSMAMSKQKIPDNIKYIINTASTIINDYEESTTGEIPTAEEIQKKHAAFASLYIP